MMIIFRLFYWLIFFYHFPSKEIISTEERIKKSDSIKTKKNDDDNQSISKQILSK